MHVVSGAILERWQGLGDEEIAERVLEGQTALFEVLMRRHNERTQRYREKQCPQLSLPCSLLYSLLL